MMICSAIEHHLQTGHYVPTGCRIKFLTNILKPGLPDSRPKLRYSLSGLIFFNQLHITVSSIDTDIAEFCNDPSPLQYRRPSDCVSDGCRILRKRHRCRSGTKQILRGHFFHSSSLTAPISFKAPVAGSNTA